MKSKDNSTEPPVVNGQESWLEMVRNQVASFRFGVVQIAAHDSQVVQIERTVKVRLDRKP